MAEPSDRNLLLRARGGDANAFGLLVQRYQTSVYNVCYRMMGARQIAEDMTQETFIRAYQRLHTFDNSRPFGPWVRTVATNVCLNRLKRKRLPLTPLDGVVERTVDTGQEDPALLALQKEDAERIRAAIARLSPQQRAVIELRHFQGLSYQEIAGELGLSLGAVKTRLFRARRELAEGLKSHG